ncbi:MAG: hypothetical protein ABH891_00695 [Candidatus Omnitrophota bacterium]
MIQRTAELPAAMDIQSRFFRIGSPASGMAGGVSLPGASTKVRMLCAGEV